MTIRSVINKLLGNAPAPARVEPVVVAPDPRGAPGTRVHHEYFTDERPLDNRWNWLCRVYAQNGAVNEQRSVADTQEEAKNAALAYAAVTKRALRGEA